MGASNNIEYVELYNPTTSSMTVNDITQPMPAYAPILWGNNNNQYQIPRLYYVNTSIPSNGFYLISNTGNGNPATQCNPVPFSGNNVAPDACWLSIPQGNHAMIQSGAGGVTLVQTGAFDSSFHLTTSWT